MTAACAACIAAPAAAEMAKLPANLQFSVPGMRCAACISAIEDGLKRVAGVQDARVNLTLRRVSVATDLPVSRVTDTLAGLGYEAHPLDAASLSAQSDTTARDLLMRVGVAGFAMMNVMLLSVAIWSGAEGATRDLFHLISAAIALPAVLYAAQPFFRNAFAVLRHGRLNMDVPISLAILLAGAMSLYEALHGGAHAYFDAALSLTFFLLIGRYLEHHTRSAARSAAKELAALEEHTARRKTPIGSEIVPIDQLSVGDILIVPTGMRVSADGTLCSGTAMTDRSFLTGESTPASLETGGALSAGEINLGAPFEMRVVAIGNDTRLRQIASLVETAENARNSYTSLADRAARIYAPAVHLLAAATFLGWIVTTGDIRQALNTAIAVLIITCPCALGLAVPAVSTAAISKLYRMGFLVKSGTALERLAEVKTVVFDKTGTLTKPSFDLDLSALSSQERGIAKALAQASSHPVSRALDAGLGEIAPSALQEVAEIKGSGITAKFEGETVALGRGCWLGLEDGLGFVWGARKCNLPYQETPVPGAGSSINDLLEAELVVELLSGDTTPKTKMLADNLGIATWAANVSPEAKQRHIRHLSNADQRPCMVGDGLNDTIALASAHASIAPGTGLDAARSAADVVMLGDALSSLPRVFGTTKKAVRLSKQNFAIALAYNAVAIPIAIFGFATPLIAALAMSASSLTVLANAMRLNLGEK